MRELLMKLMSLPPLASQHGAKVDSLLFYVHYLMAALFVVWIAYFFYVIFRFSARRNPKASYTGYTGPFTTYLEVGVAVIEVILLVGLAIPLWANAADGFPNASEADGKTILGTDGKPVATIVRITAQQFAWNGRYAGGGGYFGRQEIKNLAADNQLALDKKDPHAADDLKTAEFVVPVNKPVILHITSMDVIHSFAVHPLRIMQDAIPGVSIPVHFVPTTVGDYQITCAQLCGNSHFRMKGFFKVRSEADYETWLAAQPKAVGSASFE